SLSRFAAVLGWVEFDAAKPCGDRDGLQAGIDIRLDRAGCDGRDRNGDNPLVGNRLGSRMGRIASASGGCTGAVCFRSIDALVPLRGAPKEAPRWWYEAKTRR